VASHSQEIKNLWNSAGDASVSIGVTSQGSSALLMAPSSTMILANSKGSARSYGVKSNCSLPVGCGLRPSRDGFSFNCSSGFAEADMDPDFVAGAWNDGSSQDFDTRYHENRDRPLDWGVIAKLTAHNIRIEAGDVSTSVLNLRQESDGHDSANSSTVPFYAIVLMHCTSDVFEAQYSWLNQTITEAKLLEHDETDSGGRPANIDGLRAVLQGPFQANFTTPRSLSQSKFVQNLNLPNLPGLVNLTVSQVTGAFETTMSQITLSLLAGTMTPAAPTQLSLGRTQIVTVVPKAPLFILVILNLWYAGLGLVLYLFACYTLHISGKSMDDILKVRKLLTVEGLTRSRIAGIGADLQWHTGRGERTDENHMRIGVRSFHKDGVEKEWMFEVHEGDGWTGMSTEGQALLIAANEEVSMTPERDSENNDTDWTGGGYPLQKNAQRKVYVEST
jgi:hypothetical protein